MVKRSGMPAAFNASQVVGTFSGTVCFAFIFARLVFERKVSLEDTYARLSSLSAATRLLHTLNKCLIRQILILVLKSISLDNNLYCHLILIKFVKSITFERMCCGLANWVATQSTMFCTTVTSSSIARNFCGLAG